MNFFCIENSLDSKIVGIYPQVEKAIYHCDVWNEPKFVDRVNFIKTDFEPITANAIIRKKAKLTDLISGDIIGFTLKLLISDKLKQVIELYSHSGLQFYQSPVIFKDEKIYDYWLLNPYKIDMQYIDFSSSEVFITENTFNKIECLTISSAEEFIRVKETVRRKNEAFNVFIEKFKLVEDIKKDILVLSSVEGGVKYIVSDRLKLAMEEVACTGIEFRPVELSLNEWLQKGARELVYGKSS